MNKDIGIYLTEREEECAKLIAQGYSNEEIGKIMYCSTATVKVYVTHLLEKTNSKNRAHIVFNLIKLGFKFN